MTQPNKPAALDAIAFLYRNGRSAVIPSPLSDKPNRADTLFKAGDGWTETPLTDLTKAQERIDRLEERVAELQGKLADDQEAQSIIKRAAELIKPSDGETVFYLRVGGEMTVLNTHAGTGVEPQSALAAAIQALQAEAVDAAKCPFHALKGDEQ